MNITREIDMSVKPVSDYLKSMINKVAEQAWFEIPEHLSISFFQLMQAIQVLDEYEARQGGHQTLTITDWSEQKEN